MQTFYRISSRKGSLKTPVALPLHSLLLSPYARPWSVFHQESGGGQCGARRGGEDSGPAARRRELGPQRRQADVAV